jgi:cell wall-associated protease
MWDAWNSQKWPAGKYTIQVMARCLGGNTEYDVQKSMDFIISDTQPATSVDLVSNVTSPALRQPVQFTADARGGTGSYEYKFLVKGAANSAWTVLREYVPDGIWWWTAWDNLAWPAGKYTIQVMARSMGSNAEYDVFNTMYFTISDTPPVTDATLTPGVAGPQVAGASVTFTAGAIGGTSPYEYKFYSRPSTTTRWTTEQNYSTSDAWTWNTTGLAAGTYTLMVQARSAGSTAAAEAFKSVSYKLTDPPASGATLTASPASPQTAGTPVTLTAGGLGGTGSYEYKFFRKDPGATTWTLVRNYTTNGVLDWDTTGLAPGTYSFSVHVRTAGSTSTYDAFKAVSYLIQ